MNSQQVINDLREKHEVLYQLIASLCDRGFQFDSITYDAIFDGAFVLGFRLGQSNGPDERYFRLTRDGRDLILALEELIPGQKDKTIPRKFKTIDSVNFSGDYGTTWKTGIIEAGKKLIGGIKI